jgi:hypothetical protein
VRAGLVLPKNPIGIHSGVFVGDWKPQDAERAIKGAKEAGYDLIERMAFQIYHETHDTNDESGTVLEFMSSILPAIELSFWQYLAT